jgi:hypothetical protein
MKAKSSGGGLKELVGPAIFIVVCVLLYKAGMFNWALRWWEQFNAPENVSDYASKMATSISSEPRCSLYRYRIIELGSASGDKAARIEKIRSYYEAAGRDRCSTSTYSPGG